MDAEFKAKWVAALRSGRYRQGKNWLSHGGRHCCLGVLCRVKRVPRAAIADANGDLPRSARLLGLPIKTVEHLAKMNDGCDADIPRCDFRQIATYIEANL